MEEVGIGSAGMYVMKWLGFISISHSRLNSLGILHPCAKTNKPKNINTIVAIVRSLENTKEKIKNKSESPSENTKRKNLHRPLVIYSP